jgi:hypothetical protein
MTKRIAMWSGPRNISTAMMRSWGNRPDTAVCDEPFYAHYLQVTGRDHPGAAEVIARHETRCAAIIDGLMGPVPGGREVFYQKHMTHHMLPDVDRGWIAGVTSAFLIRDPGEMLASLVKNLPDARIEDTGLPQQVEIHAQVRRTGQAAPVVDARDVLENPRRVLSLLCEAVGVAFSESMLSWPPGPRATDGIWARHWYEAVERSTGFQAYAPKPEPLPQRLRPLLARCRALYEQLHARRLK